MERVEQITIFKIKEGRLKEAITLCESVKKQSNEFTNEALLTSNILHSIEKPNILSQYTVWRSKQEADLLANSFYEIPSSKEFINVIEETIYNGLFLKK